ncbi:hypothetical protein DBT_0546 [Dissulfuribacter thermophilus]|uniref:Uncharacterized protein n=1 Tax=Dissulfuribacter thermophilus TaxID=1156395 RepID=A0A1B9F8A4_9BACT|nr:hypothetical protein [Dissulfuribacter thermophilus]OCC16084.1 hypothetical protein DBT_0546 [Dissulfuribacter thermophilus]
MSDGIVKKINGAIPLSRIQKHGGGDAVFKRGKEKDPEKEQDKDERHEEDVYPEDRVTLSVTDKEDEANDRSYSSEKGEKEEDTHPVESKKVDITI